MSNICDFNRIKNLDEFEKDKADGYLWRLGLLNMKEK